MNKQSNTYIIGYSIVLVVIVAVVLSFTALKLKDIQQANVEVEKMSAILGSVGLFDAEKASEQLNRDQFVKDEYKKYIVESFLVNTKGEKQSADAAVTFNVLNNLKAEFARAEADRKLPVFISKSESGDINYILPVFGAGLWGPVWGYIALGEDLKTIKGVVFDHKSETPGLGAEIATPIFEDQFKGKSILEGIEFTGVKVLRGVGSSKGNNHAVDAITGGTITSRAVEIMIMNCLQNYVPFILSQQSKTGGE